MSTVAPRTSTGRATTRARGSVVGDLTVGLLVTLATAGASWWLVGLPASHPPIAALLYLPLAVIVYRRLPSDDPGPGVGRANRVTLGRAALAVPVAALLIAPELDAATRWWIIGVSTTVLVLDGVDGAVARRYGAGTRFGARFDMEVDAALILVLALLVWRSGRVGAWVILIGAMRYLFVAAALVRPELGTELPESRRRKVVCVVQGVVLLVALGPIVSLSLAFWATAGGLAALAYSFGVDVHWALRSAATRRGPRC
jgi:phosphatidylglycerophosphate synthase